MGQGTSWDQVHLFEQPVQQDETIAQKQQQQSQITMGQGALMELQQQIQQPNLQMQLMEQILDGFFYLHHRFERKNSAGVAAATTDSDGTGDKWGSGTFI